MSKALQGPKTRYQRIEKIVVALVTAARKLRQYFLAHTIVVRTDQPIRQVLARPDVAGRMMKWPLELTEFDIHYETRKALKAQALTDFVAETTYPLEGNDEDLWTVFVDGSSNSKGIGAGVIVDNNKGILIKVSLGLSFAMTNNIVEYEAFLEGIRIAK